MEINPRITGVDVSGIGMCWVYFIRGKKNAIIDTGPNKPFVFPPELFAKLSLITGLGQETTTTSAAPTQSSENDTAPVFKYAAPVLDKWGMTLADIDLILNTHIHFDHTGANAAVKGVSNAEILIHADEAIYFRKPELLFELNQAPVIELIFGKEYADERKKRFLANGVAGPGPYAAVDRQLRDNDIIELGNGCELKVIHLPGHSSGSVGFYWEKEGVLFAGDAMQGLGGLGGGLPILNDPAAYKKSLERVQQLPLKVLLHAHPFRGLTVSRTTVMRDTEIKQFLEETLEFTQMWGEAARSVAQDVSKRPFLELYNEVISKLPAELGMEKTGEMPMQFHSVATLLNYIKQIEK